MQTKNTIPAEFIANSALLKNIEHMVQAQTENEAVSHDRLIVEVQRRLNIETYIFKRCICYVPKVVIKRDI